jgi:hypothetical protein
MKDDISSEEYNCESVIRDAVNCNLLDLTNISPELKIAKTRHEFEKIWAFRRRVYSMLFPNITDFENDPYDRFSATLFTEDDAGNITSTGRLAFDGPQGLPEECLVHFLIKEHRQRGLKLAEFGRLIIEDNQHKLLINKYYKSVYAIAVNNGIDSIIIVTKKKDLGFYQNRVGAKLLSSDVNETFGGTGKYGCVDWEVSKTKSRFLKWCGVSK